MVKGVMNKLQDLTNKRFGKLTVISKAKSIYGGKTVKRYWGAWNCVCDCGNTIIAKTVHLNRGSIRSCGCLYDTHGKVLKPGQKINRLTTISYNKGKWFCLCECGESVEIVTNRLRNGNTKSCGCLKTEVNKNKADQLIKACRKFDPSIASARRVWTRYVSRDKYCNISFDQFYQLSQQNCFYCGIKPSTQYNYFLSKSTNSSDKARNEGLFIYNGLDRIDSDKYHTIDNVVACCMDCNRSKNNRKQQDFLNWVKLLQFNKDKINFISKELPKGSLATSIRCIFYGYKKDSDLTVEEFYDLSQKECYYCGSLPINKFNRAKIDKKSSKKAKVNGEYIYNGLDRLDCSKGHTKDNVVPCCKYCNFAKSKLTFYQFKEWASRVQDHQKEKELG